LLGVAVLGYADQLVEVDAVAALPAEMTARVLPLSDRQLVMVVCRC